MITSELLAKIFPGTKKKLRDRFVEPLNQYMSRYGIDTYQRACAFLATGGIETDYLRTTVEYASGADYEGRRDLGNTQKGDGRRFKGRSFFQTTGRNNYRAVTRATIATLGIDFEQNPERLAEIEVAVEAACIFWRDNSLSKYADKGEFFGVSGIVNRGSHTKRALHWEKRNELYQKCRFLIPKDFAFAPVKTDQPPPIAPESVVLTPTEPDFLTEAFDKNVSSEDVKSIARSTAPSLLKTLARPVIYLFALLEAGNVYAWLGVTLLVVFILVELYLHRQKIKNLLDKLKSKFVQ